VHLHDAWIQLGREVRNRRHTVEPGGDDDVVGLEPPVAALDDVPPILLRKPIDRGPQPDGEIEGGDSSTQAGASLRQGLRNKLRLMRKCGLGSWWRESDGGNTLPDDPADGRVDPRVPRQ
jgi:hypothetical protein